MINFDNDVPVKLKGVGDGFWITLDPFCPLDRIKSEIDRLFKKLGHLAVNANVVLDVGDINGHEDLVASVKAHLMENFDLAGVSLPPEKRSIPVERIRQRDLKKSWKQHRSDVLMLRGRVRSGQVIEARKHLVITGDANPGSEIRAGGDIIVLGKLAGKAHAGDPGNREAMVFALEFKPTQVTIGDVVAVGMDDEVAAKPEFAVVENNGIVVKDYLKASPFRKMPWPEAL